MSSRYNLERKHVAVDYCNVFTHFVCVTNGVGQGLSAGGL